MNDKIYNIAVLGGGIVGGLVIELLSKYKYINIKYLFVKNIYKCINFIIPIHTEITSNLDLILNDNEIDIYIELLSDPNIALNIIMNLLSKNKNVITANNKLIAENIKYFNHIINTKNSKLCLEASVCGGVPIIKSLLRDINYDKIYSIIGIMNGTTNYILTKMGKEKKKYKEVLTEAKNLGYTENNPLRDINGEDVRSKLIILSKLAFGIDIEYYSIPIVGIDLIDNIDFEYCESINSTIKMIGYVEENDTEIIIFITPAIISESNIISKIDGVDNIINISSNNLGNSLLIGKGVGRYPTAQSVVADIFSIINNNYISPFTKKCNKTINTNYTSKFYIRFFFKETNDIIGTIGNICENYDILIDSIVKLCQNEKEKSKILVIITEETKRNNITDIIADIIKLDICLKRPIFLPIIDNN